MTYKIEIWEYEVLIFVYEIKYDSLIRKYPAIYCDLYYVNKKKYEITKFSPKSNIINIYIFQIKNIDIGKTSY